MYSPQDNDYLFIDGQCLQNRLSDLSETLFEGESVEVDYQRIHSPRYAPISFDRIFYYDALPAIAKGESDEDYQKRIQPNKDLFNSLRAIRGVHVYEGEVRPQPQYSEKEKLKQKKVDVKIAVDVLMHTVRRTMVRATLLTGDLDFKPLIDALVQEGMYITLLYPPQTIPELIYAADDSRTLDCDFLYHWIFHSRFQAKFPLPTMRYYNQEPSPQEYAYIEHWYTSWGEKGEVYLRQENNGYVITMRNKDPDQFTCTYFESKNRDFLQRYLEERYKAYPDYRFFQRR
jgi:uncharacterized LabA/DUF88 family protein